MNKCNNTIASSIVLLCVLAFGACRQNTAGSGSSHPAPELPYYAGASFTPLWLSGDSAAMDTLHRIPAFRLHNQFGDAVQRSDFDGVVTVCNYFFTTCSGICPDMTRNLRAVQTAFEGDDRVRMLSHTAMPSVDSAAVLRQYGMSFGIKAGTWHLLTGAREELYALGREAYFVEEDLGLRQAKDAFLHTENVVLVDGRHHIRGIYNALNKADVERLILDVGVLLEASAREG